MNLKSTPNLNRSICLSVLSLAVAATAIPAEKANAIDLKFNDPVQANNRTSAQLSNLGAGYFGTQLDYRNVASGVDARLTATVSGTNYSLLGNIPNYTAAGSSNGDAAFLYQINSGTGLGGLNYKFDFFTTDGTTHDFTTAYTAPDLRFLVYDVDGEASQGEAVRIANNSGLVGYQVGNTSAALIASQDANGYLFSGRDVNKPETDASSAAILYFQNVSSVAFQFEANTRSGTAANGVFSAIDGDLSILGATPSAINSAIAAQYGARVDTSATAVPEPFTIIGTLVGGTAAVRMRKKLKSANAA